MAYYSMEEIQMSDYAMEDIEISSFSQHCEPINE